MIVFFYISFSVSKKTLKSIANHISGTLSIPKAQLRVHSASENHSLINLDKLLKYAEAITPTSNHNNKFTEKQDPGRLDAISLIVGNGLITYRFWKFKESQR